MPAQAQTRQRSTTPSRVSAGGSGSGAGTDRQSLLGNQELVQQLLVKAAEEGEGQPDFDASLRLTPEERKGKYEFSSGPDDGPAKQEGQGKQADELPKLRDKHSANTYGEVKGAKAFVKGEGDQDEISPNDVAQGQLGDCYLLAAMAAVARASPDAIRKIIKDNGDGTFDVTLFIRKNSFSKPTPVTKKVDARLPSRSGSDQLYAQTGDKAGGAAEMWPAIIEKTLAQHKGSYETIQGPDIGKDFQFHGATEMLTGNAEGYKAVSSLQEDDVLIELAAALEGHKPVTVDSQNLEEDEALTKEAVSVNVHWNHAYAVESVDLEGRTITLQNPWGSHHVTKLPVANFRKYYRGIRIGG